MNMLQWRNRMDEIACELQDLSDELRAYQWSGSLITAKDIGELACRGEHALWKLRELQEEKSKNHDRQGELFAKK